MGHLVRDGISRGLDGHGGRAGDCCGIHAFIRLWGDNDRAWHVDLANLETLVAPFGSSYTDPGYLWHLDHESDGDGDYGDWLAFRDRYVAFP